MKMIYQPRVNEGNKRKRRFTAGVIFILIVFLGIFGLTRAGKNLSGIAQKLIAPIFKAEGAFRGKITDLISFSSKSELLKENESLRQELGKVAADILDTEAVKEENSKLQAMLQRSDNKKLLLANVLSKPNRSIYDTALLDVGSENSVREGMLVFGYESVPIGKISDVYKTTALLKLFSSPGEIATVEVGEKKIPTTAVGVGGGNFRMLLPKDTPIKEGDLITLPGMPLYPLGTIEKIQKSETETLAEVFFKSAVNIYGLSEVFIVMRD
jgi:cell shape-determining protein MreC